MQPIRLLCNNVGRVYCGIAPMSHCVCVANTGISGIHVDFVNKFAWLVVGSWSLSVCLHTIVWFISSLIAPANSLAPMQIHKPAKPLGQSSRQFSGCMSQLTWLHTLACQLSSRCDRKCNIIAVFCGTLICEEVNCINNALSLSAVVCANQLIALERSKRN